MVGKLVPRASSYRGVQYGLVQLIVSSQLRLGVDAVPAVVCSHAHTITVATEHGGVAAATQGTTQPICMRALWIAVCPTGPRGALAPRMW